MKVLADSSVWIDHIRYGIREMELLLKDKLMAVHPFVIGELACGNLPNRRQFLNDLATLAHTPVVPHAETLAFVDSHKLSGLGMGWMDVNLLASSLVAGSHLWTRDKALHKAAERLKIAFYG